MSKKKFYVVWNGRKKGIFSSWSVCKKQIDGFEGAEYKSFSSLDEAEIASKKNMKSIKVRIRRNLFCRLQKKQSMALLF